MGKLWDVYFEKIDMSNGNTLQMHLESFFYGFHPEVSCHYSDIQVYGCWANIVLFRNGLDLSWWSDNIAAVYTDKTLSCSEMDWIFHGGQTILLLCTQT